MKLDEATWSDNFIGSRKAKCGACFQDCPANGQSGDGRFGIGNRRPVDDDCGVFVSDFVADCSNLQPHVQQYFCCASVLPRQS